MKFFDPHPGMLGAAVAIPEKVRLIAASCDGKRMTVKEVVQKVKAAVSKDWTVESGDGCVMLFSPPAKGTSFPMHCWRVLQYKR